MNAIEEALAIAAQGLRCCYAEQGILAGRRHFNQYWARDSFFASLGATWLGDTAIVKKNLELFLGKAKEDGQLPLRIGHFDFLRHFLLRKLKLLSMLHEQPRYSDDKAGSVPTDQNSLCIIAAADYVRKTADKAFLKEHFTELKRIVDWNLTQDKDRDWLMEEGEHAGWADSVKRRDKVLYTNVCHYKGMKDFAGLCRQAGRRSLEKRYASLAKKIQNRVNAVFWHGNYYIDFVAEQEYPYFATDGNVLAVAWGLADRARAYKIEESIRVYGINKPIPSKTNYPRYKATELSRTLGLAGMADYHNEAIWLWLGCYDAIGKHRIGMRKEALEVIGAIAEVICRYKTVFEVFDKEGKPIKQLLYSAEHPFAWSAASFILAAGELGLLKRRASL